MEKLFVVEHMSERMRWAELLNPSSHCTLPPSCYPFCLFLFLVGGRNGPGKNNKYHMCICRLVYIYIYTCIIICACTCMFCPLGDSCTGSATYDPKDRGPPTSFQKKGGMHLVKKSPAKHRMLSGLYSKTWREFVKTTQETGVHSRYRMYLCSMWRCTKYTTLLKSPLRNHNQNPRQRYSLGYPTNHTRII